MTKQSITTMALSVVALGAITEFRGVGYDNAQATVQGQKVLGFAHWTASDGDDLTVNCDGTVLAETGGVFSRGDSLIVDAQGRVIKSTGEISVAAGATAVTSTAAYGSILTGGDMPEYVVADALEDSTAAGQIVEIYMRR